MSMTLYFIIILNKFAETLVNLRELSSHLESSHLSRIKTNLKIFLCTKSIFYPIKYFRDQLELVFSYSVYIFFECFSNLKIYIFNFILGIVIRGKIKNIYIFFY